MKALILAAGKGSRLLPKTETMPKCLLPISGTQTILDLQMQALRACGVRSVVIVTGHAASVLESYAGEHHPDLSFSFRHNNRYAETGPAYSFWHARDLLPVDEPILYLNSDVLFDAHALSRVLASPAESATAIVTSAWDEEEVNVVLDDERRVLRIGKAIGEAESDGEFIGITKLSPAFVRAMIAATERDIAQNEYHHFAADAINDAVRSGQALYAVDVTDAHSMEIDSPEDYERAQHAWLA